MSARALALGAVLGLLLLQWRWHAMVAPPSGVAGWELALLYCVPLLPCLWLLAMRRRSALLVGSIAALLYFCHGVMFAVGEPAFRILGLTEAILSVMVIVASSWSGLRGRFAQRGRTPS